MEEETNQTTSGQSGASQGIPSTAESAPVSDAQQLFVDGKSVSEEIYFKAAGKSGWDVKFLRSHPEVRPSISTKEHQPPQR